MKFLDSTAVPKSKGILSGDSEIASQSGTITSSGKLKLDGAKVNNLDIGYPISLDYKLNAKASDGLMTIVLPPANRLASNSVYCGGKLPSRCDISPFNRSRAKVAPLA